MISRQNAAMTQLYLVQPADEVTAARASRFAGPPASALNDGGCRFDIYCADPVSRVPTVFGADWRWRLISTSGEILIDCGGYASRSACRSAVELLRQEASTARISDNG